MNAAYAAAAGKADPGQARTRASREAPRERTRRRIWTAGCAISKATRPQTQRQKQIAAGVAIVAQTRGDFTSATRPIIHTTTACFSRGVADFSK
jgi:hypothetical protein